MTLSYTRRFKLAVPDFLTEPWHAEFAQSMDSIDAALFQNFVGQNVQLWENGHAYKIGDIILDPTTGTLYAAAQDHTSSLTTTFPQELAAFPGRWTSFAVDAATQAEAEAGLDNTKYMTALRVAQAIDAQSPTPGVASQLQAQEATNNTEMMTPLRTREQIDFRIATKAEAEAGTDNLKMMTPLRVAEAIDAIGLPGGEQIAFSVHKNGIDQTGIVSNTPTKLTFGTELYDLGGFYDVAANRWTPPAGQVHIDAAAFISAGLTVGSTLALMVFKNGAEFKRGSTVVAQATQGVQISIDDVGNSSDYYELYVLLTSAGTGTVAGSALQTFFQGHFLGETSAVTLGAEEVGFRALKPANQGTPASVWVKVTFPTEEFDQGGFYDAAQSRWTPPTGMVLIAAQTYTASDQPYNHTAIYKNGAALKYTATRTHTNECTSVVVVADLASGTDYYEVYVNTGNGTVGGSTVLSYFFGYRVGIGPKGDTGPQGATGVAGADGTLVGNVAVPPSGRLTLLANTPVMTSNMVGGTSLIYTPYVGSRIPIYDGTVFAMHDFVELTTLLSDTTFNPFAVGSGKVNDWFVWERAGVLALTHGPNWDSDTVRPIGLALDRVKGILVNHEQIGDGVNTGPGAQKGTYVGTTRTDATSATINWKYGGTGVPAEHGVWNAYNRIEVAGIVASASVAYAIPTGTRVLDGSGNVRVSAVFGLAEDPPDVSAHFEQLPEVSGGWCSVGVGFNSTTTMTGVWQGQHVASTYHYGNASGYANPAAAFGHNTWYALERNAGAVTSNATVTTHPPDGNGGLMYRFKM